jgi:hypothetical protein
VLGYLTNEGIELSEDLALAETVVRDQVLKIGAQVLERHLSHYRLGYEGSSGPCPYGGRQRFVEYRPKTLATLVGTVTLKRAYYRCGACGASCLPYDEQIGLGRGQESVGSAKTACLLGAHDPSALDSKLLYELTGQRLSQGTIGRLTHRVGTVAAQEEAALAEPRRTGGAL